MTDEEHFERIVKLPAASREEYLNQIRDVSQRKRIADRLAAHVANDSMFVQDDLPSTSAAVHHPPSRSIGPYKRREQIGEGGMGTVYVAEQEKPVRRMVALKSIKADMKTFVHALRDAGVLGLARNSGQTNPATSYKETPERLQQRTPLLASQSTLSAGNQKHVP